MGKRAAIAKGGDFEIGATGARPEIVIEASLDRPALIRRMLDVVPNPWQGARILDGTLAKLRKRVDEKTIINSRLTLVDRMVRDLQQQLEAATESIFRAKVKSGEIVFKLLAAPLDQLNFQFHEFFKIHVASGDDKAPLLRDIGTPLARSLYETAFKKHVNGFEKDVALYLDGKDAVTWWWRISGLSRACRPQRRHRARIGDDALGNASAAARRRVSGYQHPQHQLAALARLAEARKPVSRSLQQLCGVRAGAEP